MEEKFTHEYFVERIAHFIIGMRQRNDLTQKHISKITAISISTLSRMEGKKTDSMTLYNLLKLAKLGDMTTPSSFFLYLEQNYNKQKTIGLVPWQADILKSFEKMNTMTRVSFQTVFLKEADLERQEKLINTLIEISQIDQDVLDGILALVTKLNKKK